VRPAVAAAIGGAGGRVLTAGDAETTALAWRRAGPAAVAVRRGWTQPSPVDAAGAGRGRPGEHRPPAAGRRSPAAQPVNAPPDVEAGARPKRTTTRGGDTAPLTQARAPARPPPPA
jgi:hypothetical protein